MAQTTGLAVGDAASGNRSHASFTVRLGGSGMELSPVAGSTHLLYSFVHFPSLLAVANTRVANCARPAAQVLTAAP